MLLTKAHSKARSLELLAESSGWVPVECWKKTGRRLVVGK
jgi:hypothetical protein